MVYTKTTWVASTTPVTAVNMNHIEDGIVNAGMGAELAYVEMTTPFSPSATSDATAQAFLTAGALTLDGSTRICVEFWAPYVSMNTANQNALANLYDGSTDLGRLFNLVATAGGIFATSIARKFLTPSAASHTYSIRAWQTGGAATIGAGTGGGGAYMPAYLRITNA